MKKLYTLFALMLAVTSASAQAWTTPQHMPRKAAMTKAVVTKPIVKPEAPGHEIYEDETAYEGLVADSTAAWYYADLAGSGTSTFYLLMSTNGVTSGGIPTGPGQMVQVMIFADQVEYSDDMDLPTGTFSIVPSDEVKYAAGEVYAYNTKFIDAFYNPDDPTDTENLYGYQYYADDKGSVVISKNDDGTYSISVDMNFTLTDDETYETADEKHVTMTYSGKVGFSNNDPSLYTPVEGNYEMDIPNASGRYTEDGYGYGNFSIAFYSNGMLDEDGFIVDAGDLLNIELLTDPEKPAPYSLLPGTYTVQDFYGGVYTSGHYISGCWYSYYGYYIPVGTSLTIYEEDGSEVIGLAEDGTITISDKGDGVYRFDFDFTTPEDAHLTGSWEGALADYIKDYTADGIQSISKNIGVKVDGRTVNYTGANDTTIELFAANGTRVAMAQGSNATLTAPAAGLYIVKAAGKAQKIMLK